MGCATENVPASFFGGYQDTQLDSNLWIVNFHGNKFTSVQRSIDMALLHAADLSLKRSFPYFAVTSSSVEMSQVSIETPTMQFDYYTGSGSTATGRNWTAKPGVTLGIIAFVEKPTGTNATIYDAAIFSKSIRTQYALKD
jgi:hypothetical protein